MSLGIGSIVKIKPPHEDDEWTSDMIKYSGMAGVVVDIDPCGVKVAMLRGIKSFWFDESSCVEITERKEIEKTVFGHIKDE
jgi:hypothetical protein